MVGGWGGTVMCICAFKHLRSSLFKCSAGRRVQKKVIFIIALDWLACVCEYTLALTSTLTCAEAPKPHVNLDNGGPGDCGNCCLSARWKERLSCNGSPVASTCKLLRATAVRGLPPEPNISALARPALCTGWDQFIWRLALPPVKVSWRFLFAYAGWNEAAGSPKEKFILAFVFLTSNSPRIAFSLQGSNFLEVIWFWTSI